MALLAFLNGSVAQKSQYVVLVAGMVLLQPALLGFDTQQPFCALHAKLYFAAGVSQHMGVTGDSTHHTWAAGFLSLIVVIMLTFQYSADAGLFACKAVHLGAGLTLLPADFVLRAQLAHTHLGGLHHGKFMMLLANISNNVPNTLDYIILRIV